MMRQRVLLRTFVIVLVAAMVVMVSGCNSSVGATGPMGPADPEGSESPIGPEGPVGPEGPEGPVGPEGPEGPEGPQGPEGPEGPQGPPGEDGNANVGAAVVELSNADWGVGSYVYRHGPNANTSRPARVVELEVPAITQEIYDLGMVHVYLKVPEALVGDPTAWAPLPYQYLAFGSAYHFNYAFTFNVGTLKLYYFHTTNTEGSAPPSPTNVTLADMTFKYVITGARAIESMATAGVDPLDHDAVMRFLGQYQH